ncbi:MAG: hypothetical protein ABIL46_01130 [candidate division WOR-3 bacterium]
MSTICASVPLAAPHEVQPSSVTISATTTLGAENSELNVAKKRIRMLIIEICLIVLLLNNRL